MPYSNPYQDMINYKHWHLDFCNLSRGLKYMFCCFLLWVNWVELLYTGDGGGDRV